MSTLEFLLWCATGLFGLTLSALCSGAETGLYRVNRIRLHLLDHGGDARARIMRRLLDDPTETLATLLIGNNIANYLQATAVTVLLAGAGYNDAAVLFITTFAVTPFVLIFCEILPKDLFAAHADSLTRLTSRPVLWMRLALRAVGFLPAVSLVSNLSAKLLGRARNNALSQPRHQLELLVQEGVGHGLLSDEQSAMVDRVLDLGERRVASEMVPWSKVVKVRVEESAQGLWRLADTTSTSRLPVVDATGKVIGVLSFYDVLTHERDRCPPIASLMKPPILLETGATLREALARLKNVRGALAVVVERGQPVGIVTIKDLVEPITGELASW